jgi:hypothetical protein
VNSPANVCITQFNGLYHGFGRYAPVSKYVSPNLFPRPVHVGFVVDKVVIEQGFLQVLWFSRQNHSAHAPHTNLIDYSDCYTKKNRSAPQTRLAKAAVRPLPEASYFPA